MVNGGRIVNHADRGAERACRQQIQPRVFHLRVVLRRVVQKALPSAVRLPDRQTQRPGVFSKGGEILDHRRIALRVD